MKKVLTLPAGMVVILVAAVQADDKKAEILVIDVSPDEIAKEFKDNPKEAMKKYNPRPPKPGAAGGARISIVGALDRVNRKDFHLKNSSGLQVVVRAKKINGEKRNGLKGTDGRLKSYQRGIILIECDEVEYVPYAGKDKDK